MKKLLLVLVLFTLSYSASAVLPLGQEHVLKYTYDFSALGGSTTAGITLTKGNINGVEAGCVIQDALIHVETALASGGSASVTLGPSADADGYFENFFSLVGTADLLVRAGEVAGALLWDDSNDHRIPYMVTSAANTQDVVLTVGAAGLTAGKFHLYLKCLRLED